MSDISNNAWSILPTGQSGNVMSPHYRDQAEMYISGQFRRQLSDKEEILSVQRNHSVLNPSN